MLQKSRKTTVLILAILVIYSIIANYSLVSYGLIYYSIVNPLFWFMCIVLLNILFAKSPTNTRLKKEITESNHLELKEKIVLRKLFSHNQRNPISYL